MKAPHDAVDSRCRSETLFLLLERLPLPTEMIECPICRGGGDRAHPEGGIGTTCTGECCQVCRFCMGLRFLDQAGVQCEPPIEAEGHTFTVRYRLVARRPHAPTPSDIGMRMYAFSQSIEESENGLLPATPPAAGR
jgi:hypothetical protein